MNLAESANTAPSTLGLRHVLGRFPTGVAVVTTSSRIGKPIGLTINSFSSLSLSPPLILWSLQSRSPNLNAFLHAERFAVNVLADDQQWIAERFAKPYEGDRFEGVAHQQSPKRAPCLDGVVATLQCDMYQAQRLGDHYLIVGRVLETAQSDGEPLVFHRGAYLSLRSESGGAVTDPKALERLLAAGRDSALLRFGLGKAYLDLPDFLKAVEHLSAATRQKPDYSAAWKLLGKAHLAVGDSSAAAMAWEAGIAMAEANGDVQAAKEMRVFLRRIQP